ncbi:MAG: hypothetical protein HY812_13395 [Planctomycetes bacterium]|nr:hypothetical protein [Planctomycetota bacterium]
MTARPTTCCTSRRRRREFEILWGRRACFTMQLGSCVVLGSVFDQF